jgi:short-subunit dehydrogenase
MTTALVTGATAGIGNAFSHRLAADGYGLVLVARDAVDREQLERVADRLRDDSRPVDVLVSNAGFGVGKPFLDTHISEEERTLDVMARAVLVLTRAAAPGMVARGRGNIITVSSVASFLSGGTYFAAKAWATSFTASLAGELAGTGVTATALCPGYVRTEFHQRAKMDVSHLPGWAWLTAERVVADCLADVRRGRAVSVPSLRYKAAVFFLRHIPLRLAEVITARRAALAARDTGR